MPGNYLKESLRHFQRENITFDCVFVGYLGNVPMVETVLELLKTGPAPFVICDPIMGDHGKYYSNFDDSYREALCALLGEADLLLPNLTEAALLSGVPYEEGMTGRGFMLLSPGFARWG